MNISRFLSPLLIPLLAALLPVGAQAQVKAFTGAAIFDGSGAEAIEDSVLLVRDGRVEAVGPASAIDIPAGAERVDLTGMTLTPGFINAHAHAGNDTEAKLGSYARYGVTTVVSLGGEDEADVELRDRQARPGLRRARLYVAGPVLDPASPAAAAREVEELAAMGVDWVKFRVNMGDMPPEIYQALIDSAHQHRLRAAAHMISLADAKGLLRAGADLLAHSVRDMPVDEQLITMLQDGAVCLSPTLTREVSTFAYAQRPQFYDDPFFQREAEPELMESLLSESNRRRSAAAEEQGKAWLAMAQRNLKTLSDAGVGIAFGTDSGALPGRFAGYFEHMEMALMREAGMSPRDILLSATSGAAACMGLTADLGTLEAGKWADFNVFRENPLEDIVNTKTLASTWIAGNRVPL